jgi:hypothetical protein
VVVLYRHEQQIVLRGQAGDRPWHDERIPWRFLMFGVSNPNPGIVLGGQQEGGRHAFSLCREQPIRGNRQTEAFIFLGRWAIFVFQFADDEEPITLGGTETSHDFLTPIPFQICDGNGQGSNRHISPTISILST